MADESEVPEPPRKETDDAVRVARAMGGAAMGAAITNAIFLGASVPILSVKILSLKLVTDHKMLKDNTSDWKDTGSVYSKPEWKYGVASSPVSHTKGQAVGVEAVLEVNPSNADATACNVTGTAAFGSLTFLQAIVLKGGNVTMTTLGSGIKLTPDTVDRLQGDITWEWAAISGGSKQGAGASWGHTFFATMGTPVDVGGREGGVTNKRMRKAVDLVKATGSNAPHTIVEKLMKLFPGYTLVTDPAVPAQYKHPTYFNNTEGGAWPMADHASSSAECQAIVRFVSAVIKQVGCPGTAETVVVWADPDVGGGTTVLEALHSAGGGLNDKSKTVGSETWYAYLVDTYPVEGELYNIHDSSKPKYMGLNNFEACLRFEHGGTKKYYGGGAGVYDKKEDVILAFYALCWVSGKTVGGKEFCKVRKVVKRWRDASGNILP